MNESTPRLKAAIEALRVLWADHWEIKHFTSTKTPTIYVRYHPNPYTMDGQMPMPCTVCIDFHNLWIILEAMNLEAQSLKELREEIAGKLDTILNEASSEKRAGKERDELVRGIIFLASELMGQSPVMESETKQKPTEDTPT